MTTAQFFCAEQSRQSGADIIGTASEHQIYVLVECAPPWASSDLDSQTVPDNLRALGEEIYDDYDRWQTRFLLIHSEHLKQENYVRLLIFQKVAGLAAAYRKQEFHLPDVNQVAPLVWQHLIGEPIDAVPVENADRDVLICTHGSRDRCCARFGNPLYHHAQKLVTERALRGVRIWQASHIGGHRMAPTAVTFPDARYYGYLDRDSLAAILTHTGEIQALQTRYRGCGMLPWAVQAVERELLLQQGWEWLQLPLLGRVIEQNEDESFNRVELTVETPAGDRQTYAATVVLDPSKTVHLKGSCHSETATPIEQYTVEHLTRLDPALPVA